MQIFERCICLLKFSHCRLLIWEECYYGPITYSSLPHISGIENPDVFDEWEACWVSSEARNSLLGVQAGERVRPLVNKMMMNNHVNVVGEGYDFIFYLIVYSYVAWTLLKSKVPTRVRVRMLDMAVWWKMNHNF